MRASGRRRVIQVEVQKLLEDVERLDCRVAKLDAHFRQAQDDVAQIRISTDKIMKRGAEDRDAGVRGRARSAVQERIAAPARDASSARSTTPRDAASLLQAPATANAEPARVLRRSPACATPPARDAGGLSGNSHRRNTRHGLFSKDIKTLDDLFVHTLQDIYYAEHRSRRLAEDDRDR